MKSGGGVLEDEGSGGKGEKQISFGNDKQKSEGVRGFVAVGTVPGHGRRKADSLRE